MLQDTGTTPDLMHGLRTVLLKYVLKRSGQQMVFFSEHSILTLDIQQYSADNGAVISLGTIVLTQIQLKDFS